MVSQKHLWWHTHCPWDPLGRGPRALPGEPRPPLLGSPVVRTPRLGTCLSFTESWRPHCDDHTAFVPMRTSLDCGEKRLRPWGGGPLTRPEVPRDGPAQWGAGSVDAVSEPQRRGPSVVLLMVGGPWLRQYLCKVLGSTPPPQGRRGKRVLCSHLRYSPQKRE